jgi:hypothetical protein
MKVINGRMKRERLVNVTFIAQYIKKPFFSNALLYPTVAHRLDQYFLAYLSL